MEESEIGNSFDSHEDVKPSAEALECSLVEYERTLSGPNCLSEVKSGKGALHSENFTRHEPSTFCNTGCDVDVKSEDEDTRSFASEYERTGSGSNCAQDVKLEQGLLPSGKIKLSDCGPSLCRSIGSSDVPVQMRFTYRNVFKEEPEQSIDFVTEEQLAAEETQLDEVNKVNGQSHPHADDVNEVNGQGHPHACDLSGPAKKRPSKTGSTNSGADLLVRCPRPQSVSALPKNLLTGAVLLTEVSTKPVVCGQPKWESTLTATRQPEPNPEDNRYTCDVCGHHRLVYTGDLSFCCEKCGKRLLGRALSPQALSVPYPPRIGDAVSRSLPNGAVHLNGKSTNLVQPEKTPNLVTDLDDLIRVEGLALVRIPVGLNPFKYDRSPKTLRLKTQLDLEAHKLVRRTVYRYTCDVCGHHRLVHRPSDQIFCCEKCGNRFQDRASLKRVLSAPYPPLKGDTVSKSLPTGAVHLTGKSASPVLCQPAKRPNPLIDLESKSADPVLCQPAKRPNPVIDLESKSTDLVLCQPAKRPNPLIDLESKSNNPVQPGKMPNPIPDPEELTGVGGLALVRAQAGLKPFKCDRCPKAFRLKTELKQHVLVHTEAKPFACDICGKTYKVKASCVYHRLSHTGERNFCCDVCGKKFRSLADLKAHMSVHKSERPNKCDVCGKGFKKKAHLVTHMLSHREEKQFLCDRCGKGFSIKYNMLAHRKLHDRKVP